MMREFMKREECMGVYNKSLLVSGCAAGLVINIVGLGLVPIVGDRMNGLLRDLSLPPMGVGSMIYFPLWSLLLGVLLMWLYALIKVNFASPAKAMTAVVLIVWFLAYFSSNAALLAYGFMPFHLVLTGTLWGLLELMAAGFVGSRIYKEKQDPDRGE